MAFTDLIIEVPEIITKELCDEIIDRFEADDCKEPGITGGLGFDSQIKRSTDLMISTLDNWSDIDAKLYEALSPHFADYMDTYTNVVGSSVGSFGFHDMGYQIQRTEPGEFYHWHHDFNIGPIDDTFHTNSIHNKVYCRERIFTYILYLNDRTEYPEDGRTQFYHAGETFSYVAEAGKLLLFPANIIYTHRGETLENGVKYLMTGWSGFYTSMNVAYLEQSEVESIQNQIESAGYTRIHRHLT